MNNRTFTYRGDLSQNYTAPSPEMSDLFLRIREDISCLRERYEIISEEYESKLVPDLEMFFLNNIAREIRISIYDPLEGNRVFVEYRYKVDSPYLSSSNRKRAKHADIVNLPETALFDIFIYFTRWFAGLNPEQQCRLVENSAIDWYDLDFSLCYDGDQRGATDVITHKDLSVKRYLFESSSKKNSPAVQGDIESRPKATPQIDDGHAESAFEQELISALDRGEKLHYIIYRDLESAVESIASVLGRQDKTPVRWSLSRGFVLLASHGNGEIGEINNTYNTRDPVTAIRFIVENAEENASYIFEDFHHYMGEGSAINTNAAIIRSLMRDLSRTLKTRDEYVFILSPTDSLPVELIPLFNLLKQGDGRTTSLLNRYGSNLTGAAESERRKPLIGRENKIKRMIQILCRMETNNPILVGEPGVGKTAMVEGLAAEIAQGNVPPILQGKTIFSLNLYSLVAGSRYRGDFEERINGVLDEVKSHSGSLIVFIDEIHTLLGAGSAEGSAGAEDILKPALARGDFPCIGATTFEGYQSLLRDTALARRFQKVELQPATEEEAEKILIGVSPVFERHHGVRISSEAIRTTVRLSSEYMPDQFLPGKAVKVLDSASVFVKMEGRDTVHGKDIEDEIRRIGEE